MLACVEAVSHRPHEPVNRTHWHTPDVNRSIGKIRFALNRIGLNLAGHIAPRAVGRSLAVRFLTPQPQGQTLAERAMAAAGGSLRRQDIKVGGDWLVTYQWGDPATEPYVLFSHGWSSFGLRFAGWVPRLRAMGYAVVMFDQRAHGLSEGESSSLPDFVATLRVVGRHFGRPAAVIAHSMGAASVVLATEPAWQPERFVLIAPMLDIERSARLFVRIMGAPKGVFPHFEDAVSDRAKARFSELDVGACIPLMDAPLLVIHDRRDRETPWEDGRRYAEAWPGARLFTTEGLGHNRLVDHPSVVQEVLTFLGGGHSAGASWAGAV